MKQVATVKEHFKQNINIYLNLILNIIMLNHHKSIGEIKMNTLSKLSSTTCILQNFILSK